MQSETIPNLVGTKIGGYDVRELIGQGGMGAVFLAHNSELGKDAAVKVMLPKFGSDSSRQRAEQRFRDEAKALAKFSHSSLVEVFDAGVLPDGKFFILMERLKGETLKARLLKDRCLDRGLAMSLARQLAAALHVIHVGGMVHCDVKPANVILEPDPEAEYGTRAKLLDFGLAQVQQAGRWDSLHSATSEAMGTARYMSPEQCEGSPTLSGQSDVYALGLVLFESLTGDSPYLVSDVSSLAWLRAHADKPSRRLRSLIKDASAELDELIADMLKKQSTQRPSASVVEQRLSQIKVARPKSDRISPSRTVALVTLAALLLGLSGYGLQQTIRTHLVAANQSVLSKISAPNRNGTAGQSAASSPRAPEGMALVPGQSYVMGSTPTEANEAFEACKRYSQDCDPEEFLRALPHRRVTVSSFYLDRYEITNEKYVAWLNKPIRPLQLERSRYVLTNKLLLLDLHEGASGIIAKDNKHFLVKPGFARKPVVQITWLGAEMFCESEGKRLPSEAEWELAARSLDGVSGSEPSKWPWGNDPPRCDGVAMARDTDPKGACSMLPPGPLNVGEAPQDVTWNHIHDLGGNVREWTLDHFAVPYPDCGKCENPLVTAVGVLPSVWRVVRGGNWLQNPTATGSAWRARFLEDNVTTALGFRCASPVQR